MGFIAQMHVTFSLSVSGLLHGATGSRGEPPPSWRPVGDRGDGDASCATTGARSTKDSSCANTGKSPANVICCGASPEQLPNAVPSNTG